MILERLCALFAHPQLRPWRGLMFGSFRASGLVFQGEGLGWKPRLADLHLACRSCPCRKRWTLDDQGDAKVKGLAAMRLLPGDLVDDFSIVPS